MKLPSHFQILTLRDLRFVFSATLVSRLGDGVTKVALAYAVLHLTHGSATDVGIVMAAQIIAQVAVVLISGVVADRSSRRLVMMAADVTRFGAQGAIGVLLLTHHATLALVIVSQVLVGAGTGFFDPASNGLLPAVAGDYLHEANALMGIARAAALFIGPAIGGVLVVAFGPSCALLVDAASYGISALCLACVSAGAGTAHRDEEAETASFFADLKGGFHETVSRSWVWSIILGMGLTNAFYSSWEVLGPKICQSFYGGAGAFALLTTLWGIGTLCGGTVLLRFKPKHPLRFGVLGCVPLTVPMGLVALHVPLGVVVPLQLVAGLGPAMFNALWWTALQQHIPKQAVSRVVAYDYAGSYGLIPTGMAVAGPVAALIGVAPALGIFAAAGLVFNGLVLLVPSVRKLTAPVPQADIVEA